MPGKRKLTIVWTLIALLSSLLGYSQSENIRFTNINVQNGLSANWISAVFRDSDGFMWIGTRRGLNRYDGYNSIVYEAGTEGSLSISDNVVHCITEDAESNLWVGTSRGINLKDKNSDKFSSINLFDHNAFNCTDVNFITALYKANDSSIFIATHQGYFTYKDKTFKHHLIDSSNFESNVNSILSFAEDDSGNMWMGTDSRNLFCIDNASKSCDKIAFPESFSDAYISGLYQLLISDNKVLVGTRAGLLAFDIETKQWDKQTNNLFSEQIGNEVITGIQKDKDGQIWVSTDGRGLFILNLNTNKIQNINHLVYDNNSLSTDGLYCLLIDRHDIVWAGTYKQGLDYYKRNSQNFMLWRHQPGNLNSLISNDINCIIEDSEKNLWFGSNGSGISILNRHTNTYKHMRANSSKSNSLSSDVIVSLFEDSEKNIWIGTYYGGLNKYNRETGEITVFQHSIEDTTTISDDRIWSIIEDKQHNIWVGTMGGGLNKYNPRTNQFTRYSLANSNIAGDYVNHIFIDSKEQFWVSTSDGLSLYSPEKNDFTTFINPQGENGENLFGIQVSAFEDSRNLLWLCTSNGLIQFNYEAKTADYYNTETGFQTNPVNRILEDNNKNLWVSSSNGLTQVTFKNNRSAAGYELNFSHFDESDGLQNNEFSETAALKTSNGELIFGGVDGVNMFHPDQILTDDSESDLAFLNLRIFNETVIPNQPVDKRIILKKSLNKTNEIVLNYAQNFFSIEFAVLNYLSPNKNKYRYRLLGFDDKWFETGGLNNFATYTNLNNGTYTFEVLRANTDGSWNRDGISLKIIVLPPIWKRWYAFLFYIGFISLILFALRYMILSKERLRVQFENKSREAERIHELDLAKIKFFTNVSHEFRTPLTLILSPLEKLLPKYKNKADAKYLNHIYVNSKKLLYLINQLLDFRKMEIRGLKYNPVQEDVIVFINEVVVLFNDLSENKNISFRLVTDVKKLVMLFDKDKLEKILYNLLSNAFKFTPVNGLVLVEVSVSKDNNDADNPTSEKYLVIKIKDNGVGIKQDLISKIFTRFYQAEDQNQVEERGTGIGLSMVKEYVAVHNGKIEVESAVGVGTCFTVALPIIITAELELEDRLQTTVLDKYSKNLKPGKQVAYENINGEKKALVLIVEDNDDLRAYLRDNLSEKYDIIEAENGKQGLSSIINSMPDIVLSDIMMPEMDGIELCKQTKGSSITCHIPFVFLTAKNTEQQQLEGLEIGADDYISKPFNLEILEQKIRNLLQLKFNIQNTLNTKLAIKPKDISITSLDNKFMEQALDLIEVNMSNSNFTVEEFSRSMGISRMQLYKKLVSLTGKTPLEFIRILRLKRSANLLRESQLTVSEIAYQVGFNDPKNFSKHFKKEFKILPSKYSKSET